MDGDSSFRTERGHGAKFAWNQAMDGARSGTLLGRSARRMALETMRDMVDSFEADMAGALQADMGRGAAEAWTSELTTLVGEIDHALSNLKSWMKPEKARVPVKLWPAKASIRYEPKGTALVIGAWNLPFAVTLAPAVAAIAAGNSVVCKPSELAPASAKLMAELVERHFDWTVLQVLPGDAETTKALLEHRWGHVFFTGSARVGRQVAMAAASTGSPVTLELGGKCAAYVHASADLEVAARRITWGKFMNAGQVCIAPDYAIVDEGVYDAFVRLVNEAVGEFYGPNARLSEDYARIVNERHFERLSTLTKETDGIIAIDSGEAMADELYFPPTVVSSVSRRDALMSEEIFGPILPVVASTGADDALNLIASLPEPLAIYPFARDSDVLGKFEDTGRAGAVVSNDVVVNHAVRSLPFGGVGASGHGTYHGVHGFRTFSHSKAVLRRGTRSDPALRYPPYTASKLKWLKRLG